VELALLIIPNYKGEQRKTTLYGIFIATEVTRTFIFLILPTLYFRLRNDEKEYDNSDAERQALLSKKLSAKPGSENSYGTASSDSDTAENASEADSEDSWVAEQRKAQEKIAKRLAQDGNWFTYAKGFSVGRLNYFPDSIAMLTIY
jgi:hypothetical protein